MRSDSLTRSSAASRNWLRPVGCRHGHGDERQLVDDVGDPVAVDVDGPEGPATAHGDAADRLRAGVPAPSSAALEADLDVRAHVPQHVDDAGP